MKTKVNDELKKHFRPEFLNRIDDIVVFHQLTEERSSQMVDLMIAQVDERLANKDMAIELTAGGEVAARRRGFDPVLGARPLRRTIQREIEDPLSEKILFGEIKAGQIVMVDVEGSGENLRFTFHGASKTGAIPELTPTSLEKGAPPVVTEGDVATG